MPNTIVLIIGGGGREHAIAWKLKQSEEVLRIYVAPGNAGTAMLDPKVENVEGVSESSPISEIVGLAVKLKAGLVVPGSEMTLVEGITDALKAVGIACFGPSMAAAALEGSKAFSKRFMKENEIPTAKFAVFHDFPDAVAYVKSQDTRLVIKASGPAFGKGVFLPTSESEAIETLESIMLERCFGDSGKEVVIEEFLEGEEVSLMAFADGYTVRIMPPAQDHKRVGDDDTGLNTGGMGAYAPAIPKCITNGRSFIDNICATVMQRTVDAIRKSGTPYVGVLYAGLLVAPNGAHYVLEYNARFGDPEAQTVLPLLDDDLFEIMMACCNGYLDALNPKFNLNLFSVCVVLASEGYPGNPKKNVPISLKAGCGSITNTEHAFVGAIAKKADGFVVSGGRAISLVSCQPTLHAAVVFAYSLVKRFEFQGHHFRSDIANRGLNRSSVLLRESNYADAGVSIDRGNEMVERIRQAVSMTQRKGSDGEIGGYGGVFDLKAAGYGSSDSDLLLVSSTDGVGTKLRVAIDFHKYGTIGQDLVAMSVNDIVVTGAEPLFFLDYYACGFLDVDVSAVVIEGIASACVKAHCAMVGGETAEMPGMYDLGDFDIAGFAVGVVRRSELLPKIFAMQDGDLVVGLPSSGVHSNGYSLVRKIIEECNLTLSSLTPFESEHRKLGDALLEPTTIYVDEVLRLTRQGLIKGAAHITGGGLTENIPRVIPESLSAHLNAAKWRMPQIFQWLHKAGNVQYHEMLRTFNCGIGMVMIVSPEKLTETRALVPGLLEIGKLAVREPAQPSVKVDNLRF